MQTAIIKEQACIGCGICLDACLFDAIIGAKGQMHTVLVAECIGCKLCVNPCPVDCITIAPITSIPIQPDQLLDKRQMVANAKHRRAEKLKRIKSEPVAQFVTSDIAQKEIEEILLLKK